MITPAGRAQGALSRAASSAGERLPHTQEVVGSNPTPPTTPAVKWRLFRPPNGSFTLTMRESMHGELDSRGCPQEGVAQGATAL
jgi:hypothetical protein